MISEPAVGKAFFGRTGVMRVLEKRVNALKGGYRQNVALTGQMLSGKSSILSQLLYSLNEKSLIPIYVEVVEEPFASFAGKFVATMLFNFLTLLGVEARKDLPSLIKASEKHAPHTICAIGKMQAELSRKNYNDAYRKLLSLTSVLKKETGKSCIVILDEFHNMEHLKIKKPYLHFGKIIMIQKDTMYIVSSSQKSTFKKILSEKLALLYGNFEIIEVSGFDNKTADAFLREKLDLIDLPENHANYLIDFTDGNPFYLDVIAKKMREIASSSQKTSVDKEILVESFTSLIYNTSGTINQYFTNNIMNLVEKTLRKDYLDILVALACGRNRLKDIASWLHKKSTFDISKKLIHLSELDMVRKNGSFYEMQDNVFKFWIKTVYHKRKNALVDDILNRTDDFRTAVNTDTSQYLAESHKSVTERVKELFLSFNGETVEVEKKNRKLPRFTKIEINECGTRLELLPLTDKDKYWVLEINSGRVDETAVIDLLGRYRNQKDNVAKRICVALGGIDRNALLLAKEKNIWVWSLDNINSLLRLYKRHTMITK